MVKEIVAMCDKFKAVLKNPDELKERAKTQKMIFPHFFRRVEIDLYARYHTDYEKNLRAKGWK